jgi:hypothetical protein
MLQPAHHHYAFARTRMLRVLDQNVKGLFLGSMSPSRRGQAAARSCAHAVRLAGDRPGCTDESRGGSARAKAVVKTGKAPVLDGAEWRKLLDSIPALTLRNLRDRALIATLTYSFAR